MDGILLAFFMVFFFMFLLFEKDHENKKLKEKVDFFEKDFDSNEMQYSSPISQWEDKEVERKNKEEKFTKNIVILILLIIILLIFFKK
jgi:Na+/H+ antiporter NhaC